MGKKSTYSTVSVSSIEYGTDCSETPLQGAMDIGQQFTPSVYDSPEIGGSSSSFLYESKHIPADEDITMVYTIPISGMRDEMQEPPGYEGAAMLSQHGTELQYPPSKTSYHPEGSKTALTRSFNLWKNLRNNLVHLLALATTIPVLWLNFSNKYWADETNWRKKWFLFNMNQQDSFNALQFAAKLHEIFVAASVSAMIMHIVRRKLVGRSGLPFGLVVGAYQIGSAEYFKSKSFVIPFFKSIFRSQWNVVFVALIVGISIVYVNMIGPASAALLIPALDWYPVKDPFNGLPLTTYFMPSNSNIITDHELYPRSFKISDKPWLECTNASAENHQLCPGGGFDQIYTWFSSWALSGMQYDPLIDVFLGKMKRPVVSRIAGDSEKEPGIAVASTIHTQIARALDLFSQYVDLNSVGNINNVQRPRYTISHETPIYSPLVQVQCSGVDQRSALKSLHIGSNLSFATNLMQNFSKEQNFYKSGTWQVPTSLWSEVDASTDIVNFTWIPASVIQGMDGTLGALDASIAALARVPVAMEWEENGTNITEQDSLVVSCILDARWARTAVSYDPKQDSTAHFNLTDPTKLLDETLGSFASDFGVSDTIILDTDWADLLNLPQVIPDDTSNTTVPSIELLLSRFVDDLIDEHNDTFRTFYAIRPNYTQDPFYANVTNTIEILLSTLVVDGISRANDIGFYFPIELSKESDNGTVTIDDILRQAGSWDISPITNYSVSDLEHLDHIDFTVERYGWGYGLNPPTAKFAVSILLAYVAGLILFLITCSIFRCRRRGWMSEAWGDVGELVALAAMSRESEALQNTGAGIDKGATWMIPVRIRERESSRVEIVFGDAEGGSVEAQRLLKVGKKYR